MLTLTLILLISAAIVIPHLFIEQHRLEQQLAVREQINWAYYDVAVEASKKAEALRKEISSTHRISKRFAK